MRQIRIFLKMCSLLGVCVVAGCGPRRADPAGRETVIPTTAATKEIFTPTDSPTPGLISSPTGESRFQETGGEIPFSYVAPDGWTSDTTFSPLLTNWYGPEQPAMVCFTLSYIEEAGNYQTIASCRNNAILVFFMTPFQSSPKQFYEGQVRDLLSYRDGMELESAEDYPTPADDQSYRVIFEYLDQGQSIRIILYSFHQAGQILVAGYARLTNEGSELDEVVESTIQSLRLEE